MKNQNPILHTPEGVRDIYGSEFVQKFELQQLLYRVLAGQGYQGIETPTFEFFDVFSREVGTVPSRELYKFFDKEGNTLALRPDMTPSIARAVSKYFHDETPIRLCYMGNTFINYDKYQGRLKETTQLGAELMGEESVEADVELLSVLIEALKAAGLREFQVSVGQVEFFKALLKEAGIGSEAEESLREAISFLPSGKTDGEEVFVIADRDGKIRISFGSILYFEARAKKIYASLEKEEYGFYESMEHLLDRLPPYFVRCHRSYVVNLKRLKRYQATAGICVLGADVEIPVSRSYRQNMKERFLAWKGE